MWPVALDTLLITMGMRQIFKASRMLAESLWFWSVEESFTKDEFKLKLEWYVRSWSFTKLRRVIWAKMAKYINAGGSEVTLKNKIEIENSASKFEFQS